MLIGKSGEKNYGALFLFLTCRPLLVCISVCIKEGNVRHIIFWYFYEFFFFFFNGECYHFCPCLLTLSYFLANLPDSGYQILRVVLFVLKSVFMSAVHHFFLYIYI